MEQSPTMSFPLSVYLSVFCPRSVLSLTLIAAGDEGAHLLRKGARRSKRIPPETSNDEDDVRGEARWATAGPRVSRSNLNDS